MRNIIGSAMDSAITPKSVYLSRRHIVRAFLGATIAPAGVFGARLSNVLKTSYNPGSEKLTPLDYVTGFNNFYELGTGKLDPAKNAANLQVKPWTLKIEGEVTKPTTLDMDAILKLAPLEERIYRHRCVEGWSMVIPWIGFPVSALLKHVEPTGKARFVTFESSYDSKRMLSQLQAGIAFPYIEGITCNTG
jgi:sulfoxide reductase catalytic subunit YedY